MQNRQIYLFPCAGFASPQLDVPCYQFIATWKRGDGGEMKNYTADDPCWTEGGTVAVPHDTSQRGRVESYWTLRSWC